MTTQRSTVAALRASEACALLFVELGHTALTAAEIAKRIGVAERTFYRYFPHKRDTIRPILDQSSAVMAASIAESVDLPIKLSLAKAFRDAFGAAYEERTRRLYPLIFADREMWAVLLQAVHEGAASVRPAMAGRLGIPADGIRARSAAAIFVSAILISLELMVQSGTEPFDTFSAVLTASADEPLLPNRELQPTKK